VLSWSDTNLIGVIDQGAVVYSWLSPVSFVVPFSAQFQKHTTQKKLWFLKPKGISVIDAAVISDGCIDHFTST
jgi:hypothetical protein